MSLGKHAVINLAGNVLPMLVALVSIPLFLGYIGLERYGTLNVIWTLLAYFSFLDLGLGRAVSQRMAQLAGATGTVRSELLWTAVGCTLLLGLLGSFTLAAVADFILPKFIELPTARGQEVNTAVTWLLVSFPVLLLTSVLQGALQAQLRFFELNAIQVAGAVLSQILPLALAAIGFVDLTVLVPAALASRLLVVYLMFVQCRRFVPLAGMPRISGTHLKPLLRSGGWFSVIGMLGPMLVTVDRLVIGGLHGAKAVSHYTVPYDLVSRTMVISASLSSAIFPRLASAAPRHAKEMALHATAVLMAVMTPVVVLGLFIVHPFMTKWVGTRFAEASFGVPEIILIGVWINALVIPHNARLLASGSANRVATTYLIQLPIYLLMLYVFVTHWGIVGAAAAWTLRVCLDTAMLLRLAGTLRRSLHTAASSAALVGFAMVASLMTSPHSEFRWTAAGILLLLSIFKDRQLLSGVVAEFGHRGAAK